MKLLLDTSILGQLCHPAWRVNREITEWVTAILKNGSGDQVFVPEVCDYELRRKLLHLIHKGQSSQRSLDRLNELSSLLDYLPLDTLTMRKAAEFWRDSRVRGTPTAAGDAIDGDVILAAQAACIGGTIVTENRKHLIQFVPAYSRSEIGWTYVFICVNGAVENLAFDWRGHFMVLDSQNRTWHCRLECVRHYLNEIQWDDDLQKPIIAETTEMLSMYQKLFSSGNKTDVGTTIAMHLIASPLPLTRDELTLDLREGLGEKNDSTE